MQCRTLALACSIIYATCAVAAQPPDIVTSDLNNNTASGTYAMADRTGVLGGDNSAFGAYAMVYSTADSDTAVGVDALQTDTGERNTAVGIEAMAGYANAGGLTGSYNVAVGYQAFSYKSTGSFNVAVGYNALVSTGEGSNNVAVGGYALSAGGDPTGKVVNSSQNTAVGDHALFGDTEGNVNTAVGANALYHIGKGYSNVAAGYSACWSCSGSFSNVALGNKTLYSNESGTNNIAIGNAAGYNSTGSYNIEIGNAGQKLDAGVIRIGASNQTTTYIAGINSSQVVGAPVYVTSSGQLGVLASSERYKTDIRSIDSDAAKFAQLRPVTFRLKTDPQGTPQYGLIAEEVNKIYPDLVIHDSTGTIQGVRYDEVTSLLLAQMQLMEKKQQAISTEVELLAEQNKLLRAQLEALGGSGRLAAQ